MLSLLKTVSNHLKTLFRFFFQEEGDAAMRSGFDSVKAEKDDAMRLFNRRRRAKWLFEACAVSFVVAHFSNYWLPIAADLLRETVAIFRSHLFVFALFNSIILAIYALSAGIPRQNDAASESDDIYDEFLTNSKKIPVEPETSVSDNAGESVTPAVIIKTVMETKPSETDRVVKRTALSASFREPRSDIEGSRREFRRSYTDVRRRLSLSAGEEAKKPRPNSVNRESDEEFNRRIEDFIAAQKLIQQEECKEERAMERFTGTALAVCP